MRGYIDSPDVPGPGYAATGYLLDGEYVYRDTGLPYNDDIDVVTGSGPAYGKSQSSSIIGSLLVCETYPPQYPESLVNINFEQFSNSCVWSCGRSGARRTTDIRP